MKLRNLLLTIGFLLAAGTAEALPISLSLTSSLLTGTPTGTTLTFFGTVTETGGSVAFLNAANASVASPLVIDETPFLLNFPLFLNPFQSVTAAIFRVTIPVGTPLGPYAGQFQILGGSDGDAQDVLATQAFGVIAAVPEPATAAILLIGIGLVGAVCAAQAIARSLQE